MALPILDLIDLKECGFSLGTVLAEMRHKGLLTSHQVDHDLVALVHQMINGQDTRETIVQRRNGRFYRLLLAAESAAENDAYLAGHVQAIKAPFGIN